MKKRDELYLGLFDEKQEFLLKKNFPIFLLILAVLVLLAFAFVTTQAEAREGYRGVEHGEYYAESGYQNWTIPGTKDSCCSHQDCQPTLAKWVLDASGQEGHWEAAVNGMWKRVPDKAILDVPSPDGRAHVCENPDDGIVCFRPPTAKV